jgi:hypothetical protein
MAMDYDKPEPHAQPIIAPDEDSDKRRAQGLPLPARPNWLCITDPKNLATVPASMTGYLTHPKKLTEAEKTARKKERDARRRAKVRAREKEKAKAKRERERIREKKAKEKAKAKKTPEEMLAMRRKQAAYMREFMAKKRAMALKADETIHEIVKGKEK